MAPISGGHSVEDAIEQFRQSLENSNRAMTVLTWVICICTVLLLFLGGWGSICSTWFSVDAEPQGITDGLSLSSEAEKPRRRNTGA